MLSAMNLQFIAYRFSGNIEKRFWHFREYCYGITGHPSWQMYPSIILLATCISDEPLLPWQALSSPIQLGLPSLGESGLVSLSLITEENDRQLNVTNGIKSWMPFRTPAICLGIWNEQNDTAFVTALVRYQQQLPLSFYPESCIRIQLSLNENPWSGVEWQSTDSLPVRKRKP